MTIHQSCTWQAYNHYFGMFSFIFYRTFEKSKIINFIYNFHHQYNLSAVLCKLPFSEQSKNKEDFDPGTKSEGEEDSQCSTIKEKNKPSLGKTPNHLTLSTASTLSTGSTSSQARLIQSSQHPKNYQPPVVKDLGKTTQLY